MSDEVNVQVEEEKEQGEEFVELKDGEALPEEQEEEVPEELRGKSPKQIAEEMRALNARLQQSTDSGNALRDGLAALGEKLTPQQTAAPLPVQQSGESDEEYAARISKEMFQDGTAPYKAILDVVKRTGKKEILGEIAPALNMMLSYTMKMAEATVKADPVDGKVFKKYEKEIREEFKRLPAEQQRNPEAWQYLVNQAKVRHFGESVEEAVERTEQTGGTPPAKPAYAPFRTESVTGARSTAPRRIFITEQVRQEALELGMPVEEYAKRRESLKRKG